MAKKIQFTTNKSGGFKLPPEGTFELQVVDAKFDKVTQDGDLNPMLQLEIVEGPEASSKFRQYYTLNEDRGWVFRDVLDALGVDYEVIESDDPDDDSAAFEFDPDDVLNRYMRAELTHYHNPKNGKTYINLGNLQPSKLGDGADEADEADEEPAAAPPRRRRRTAAG